MYTLTKVTNFDEEWKSIVFYQFTDAYKWAKNDWEETYNNWIDNYGFDEIDQEHTESDDYHGIVSAKNGNRVEWFIIQTENSNHEPWEDWFYNEKKRNIVTLIDNAQAAISRIVKRYNETNR